MVRYNMPTLTGGVDDTLVEVVQAVPSFIGGLLFFIWGVIFIGGSATQKAKSGYADMPMWSVMASIATFLVTLALSLREGLMNTVIFGVVVGITIMSALWLFLSKGRGEI